MQSSRQPPSEAAKSRIRPDDKISAEKWPFRKFFIYLRHKSYAGEMNARKTYASHDREMLRGMMMDMMMCMPMCMCMRQHTLSGSSPVMSE